MCAGTELFGNVTHGVVCNILFWFTSSAISKSTKHSEVSLYGYKYIQCGFHQRAAKIWFSSFPPKILDILQYMNMFFGMNFCVQHRALALFDVVW